MDLTKVANPYDFANPISEQSLFIGRKQELEEISYYLEHALSASRPINIAFLGDRASGKTSLLNITEVEAKNRGFCTARIDLDEDDSKSQMSFFFKVFDSIFSAVCAYGGFQGRTGQTYSTYLDIIYSNRIPDDLTFCPFVFPLVYARAMGGNNQCNGPHFSPITSTRFFSPDFSDSFQV